MTLAQHREAHYSAVHAMKSPKPLFGDLKSVALVLALIGLIVVSGFISSRTLTETSIENPQRPGVSATPSESAVNANSGEAGVKGNDGELGVGPGETDVRSGNPDVTVWVNTKSGVYHCPNTRWYGNTKNGKYMTQREARAKGYRPAYGAACG